MAYLFLSQYAAVLCILWLVDDVFCKLEETVVFFVRASGTLLPILQAAVNGIMRFRNARPKAKRTVNTTSHLL